MVRMDGELGNVPGLTACRERGLPFICLLNRPALYTDPEVLERLRQADWHRVVDSGSGPTRAAADIGLVTLQPSKDTKRPDGSRYEAVTVRVVASIYPNKSGKVARGRLIDGWQVELYAVDLPAADWPAPEAIALYFGRASEENRFAQEDKELGLDRIISYHVPGQELATLVGLFLWNLRVARGFAQEPVPVEQPRQKPRHAERDDRVPEAWPRDPVVLQTLAQLDWPRLLERRPGWSWDADAIELRCPDGRPLALTSVRPKEHAPGRTGIIFRRPAGGCDDCRPRQDCSRSTRAHTPKHAEFAVATAVAAKLRKRLLRVRRVAAPAIAPITVAAGPKAVHDALFLPAAARQLFRKCFIGSSIRIQVKLPPPDEPRPQLLAADVAERQRRRKTWTQNLARYRLPEDARVNVEVQGPETLRAMIRGPATG